MAQNGPVSHRFSCPLSDCHALEVELFTCADNNNNSENNGFSGKECGQQRVPKLKLSVENCNTRELYSNDFDARSIYEISTKIGIRIGFESFIKRIIDAICQQNLMDQQDHCPSEQQKPKYSKAFEIITALDIEKMKDKFDNSKPSDLFGSPTSGDNSRSKSCELPKNRIYLLMKISDGEFSNKLINMPLPLTKKRDADLTFLVDKIVELKQRQISKNNSHGQNLLVNPKIQQNAPANKHDYSTDKGSQTIPFGDKKAAIDAGTQHCQFAGKNSNNVEKLTEAILKLRRELEVRQRKNEERETKLKAKIRDLKFKVTERDLELQRAAEKYEKLRKSAHEQQEGDGLRLAQGSGHPRTIRARRKHELANDDSESDSDDENFTHRKSTAKFINNAKYAPRALPRQNSARRDRNSNRNANYTAIRPRTIEFGSICSKSPAELKRRSSSGNSGQRKAVTASRSSSIGSNCSNTSTRSAKRFDPTEFVKNREKRRQASITLRNSRIRSAQNRVRSLSKESGSQMSGWDEEFSLTRNRNRQSSNGKRRLSLDYFSAEPKLPSRPKAIPAIYAENKPKNSSNSNNNNASGKLSRDEVIDIESRLNRLQALLNET